MNPLRTQKMTKALPLCAALLAAFAAFAAQAAPQAAANATAPTSNATAAATNTAAPLGLELGKSKCARLAPAENHVRTGKSEWAGGDTVELRHLERFHLAGLTRVTLNCDAQDTVALITMTFDRSALEDVRGKLDARYASLRRTEASAENGYAEWAAANGSLELLYGRDGKHFTVAYWARNAKARYFSYSGAGSKPAAAVAAPQPAPL
ncbi:conserved exported hypothetical protein [Cupriavidus oxalaticus]|uniref:DUF1176 domain-containing protein n=2 Tax=Cupriavidus oxalaticus TaxID=96344 RepID=A0A976BHC2_9BURK|nr:conserved exported hypothetical protein [Cupriavidus oxalaticus]